MTTATSHPTSDGLKRQLSLGFSLAVIVGGIIGVGVLRTPGEIAAVVQSPQVFIGLWLVGGLFVLLSTAVVAELVGMTNRSGGTYAMVRRAYGPFPGFVIGWNDWLSFVGDIAFKAVVVIEFLGMLVPVNPAWQMPMSIMVTTVFAALQIRGIVMGAMVQQVAAASIAVIIVGFALVLLFSEPVTAGAAEPARTGMSAWSLVIASIVLTYDGWTWAAYFNGETRGGSGAVARACIRGVIVVMALYLLLMGAMAWTVPLSSLAGSELALARALELAVSPTAATMVVGLAILILLAHQNLLYMSAPRILQALAVDGLALRSASVVARGGNPLAAVIMCWAVTVFLVLIGGFDFLVYLLTFFYIISYLVVMTGVMILRARKPDTERPYRAWGHPWSTVACLFAWTLIAGYQTVAEWETALYALAMVAVAWPVYRLLSRKRTVSSGPESD